MNHYPIDFEVRSLAKSWAASTLREKRIRLVEERLGAVAAEARLLGLDPTDLARTLRQRYEEEP